MIVNGNAKISINFIHSLLNRKGILSRTTKKKGSMKMALRKEGKMCFCSYKNDLALLP